MLELGKGIDILGKIGGIDTLGEAKALLKATCDQDGWAKLSLIVWVLVISVGPLVIGSFGYTPAGQRHEAVFKMIWVCSPIGSLISIWDGWGINMNFGLVFQGMLVLLMAVLFYSSQKQIQKRTKSQFAS